MKETTIDLIRTVLRSDETVSREHQDSILRACRQTAIRRKLIGAVNHLVLGSNPSAGAIFIALQ